MKKLSALVLSFAVMLWISGINLAAAQGHGDHGKPSQPGVEHAETVANPQGVQHGIENAESKQGKTDTDSKVTKSKHKKHHHKKHNDKKS